MATTTTGAALPALAEDTQGALSTDKTTYKGFAKFNAEGNIEGKINAKAETKADVQEGWNKLLASGSVEWNQNEFIRYVVHTIEGFNMLVPDKNQQVYVIQAGLNYIQNAKANKLMVEQQDAPNENSPVHNGETIDLREYINEPPEKRSLTDRQKLDRLIKSMGLADADAIKMLEDLAKTFAAQIGAEAEA